jgi:hypothetical protein
MTVAHAAAFLPLYEERDIFEALAPRLRESNILTDSRYVSVE